MDSIVREFALQMLRRLQKRPTEEQKRAEAQANGDENMEDGQLPTEDLVQTPYLPEHIELPAQKANVLQHVELLFALSVKVPEFLDEYELPIHEISFPLMFFFQDIHRLWPNGRICSRSHSRIDHSSHQISWLQSWQASNDNEKLPSRRRITGTTRPDHLHRKRPPKFTTCRDCQGFDQRT